MEQLRTNEALFKGQVLGDGKWNIIKEQTAVVMSAAADKCYCNSLSDRK